MSDLEYLRVLYLTPLIFCLWLQAILNGFLNDFLPPVKQTASNIVEAAVEIYNRMSVDLLPTPAKSHYVFNLRDLSKCVQGSVSYPHSLNCSSPSCPLAPKPLSGITLYPALCDTLQNSIAAYLFNSPSTPTPC